MLKSMTGYGRSNGELDGREILVEIKSVNHRYFEFSARIPRAYGYLEEKLKKLVNMSISRGKVDVGVTVFTASGSDAEVKINVELARGYADALRSINQELKLNDNLSLSSISRFQDIFMVTKTVEDEAVIWNAVKHFAVEAIERFVQMRTDEGEQMCADVNSRLQLLLGYVKQVEELSPRTVSDYRARLTAKLNEVLQGRQVDEQRVLTEVAILSEKLAVDEETVRLRSHLQHFEGLLRSSEAVGRKLDFLVQEINREVNTIGSKCQDLEITGIVVEMKSELEKIREQIQNIE